MFGRALLILACAAGAAPAAETLNNHPVRLDASGRLLSWVEPQDRAYDRVMRLAWDFLLNTVPVEANGLKTYYAYCCIDSQKLRGTPWPHNPAGLYAMLAESAAAYYAYSGDRRVADLVRGLLDYQLAHGTTPANWFWGGVPYASSDHGATEYRGAYEFQYDRKNYGRGDGYGVIEPDKAGELGLGYLTYYKLTGDARYRDAALECARTLARRVRRGDDTKSPWPFRVYAETGIVREEYSANVIFPIRLFEELARLYPADAAEFTRARDMAWAWLMQLPMQNNVWVNYFEDMPYAAKLDNFNQYSPMETARYLMNHPERDPGWRAHVTGLIQFVEKTFAADVKEGQGRRWGANIISEQVLYMPKMGSHTSRYASVLARWSELTGDADAKEKAFRSLNWASYMCRENGHVSDQPQLAHAGLWFTDGYGDYIRHFMASLGAVPEWAPDGENHLLRSSSVISEVKYDANRVAYRVFDSDATEVLRLSFTPSRVTTGGAALAERRDLGADGWTFDPKLKVMRIRHHANDVEIAGGTSR